MLALLRARLPNDPDTELRVAAARAGARSPACAWRSSSLMSPITSHVLDTALGPPGGRPARSASTCSTRDGQLAPLAERVTNDRRPRHRFRRRRARSGAQTYRLTFDTGAYFAASGRPQFYPHVDVVFTVVDADEHHHIPLLLSPFGYSTYRGS